MRERGAARVGLLGTIFTMEKGFYRDRLRERHGVEAIVPPPAERREVDGRPLDFFTWERTDRAAELRETANRLAGAAKGAGR